MRRFITYCVKSRDTTRFSGVVLHFLPSTSGDFVLETPPTLVAWYFNFGLMEPLPIRQKLNDHAAEAGGVSRTKSRLIPRRKVKDHAAEAGVPRTKSRLILGGK